MRALVKWGDDPDEVDVRDAPAPRVDAGDALLAVEACGLCGSDLHAISADQGYEWVRAPVTLGHEIVGRVADVGAGVPADLVGRRVGVIAIQGCRDCGRCGAGYTVLCARRRVVGLSYSGGAADMVTVPASELVPLPDDLTTPAAALLEPLSVAVRAAARHGAVVPGERVAVSGPGPIGLLAALTAADAGADTTVVGTRADSVYRLPLAERLGLRATHDPPTEVDLWIEASGAPPALRAALEGVRAGGRVVAVGLFASHVEIDLTRAVRREVRVATSYGSVAEDYASAAELLGRGAVDAGSLVTAFPLADAPDAIAGARAASVVKPVLVP